MEQQAKEVRDSPVNREAARGHEDVPARRRGRARPRGPRPRRPHRLVRGAHGPVGVRARRRSSTSSRGSIDRATVASRSLASGSRASSEGALAKWRSSTIGFVFQSYNLLPGPDGARERRAPALAHGAWLRRAEEARADRAARRRARRPHAALPAAALGRSGAARRDRARHRQRPDHHRGRRADGRPRSRRAPTTSSRCSRSSTRSSARPS